MTGSNPKNAPLQWSVFVTKRPGLNRELPPGVKSHPSATLFASKNDPSDGAETGVAEPHIAEQSRSWRAAGGVQEVMRGS